MKHNLSRRSFLKLAGLTGAAVAMPRVLRSGLALPAFAQASKTLTIGINAEVLSLDPHHVPSAIIGARIYHLMFDQLTRTDTSGNVLPMLATEWAATDDTTWVFTLREGVKFHDGTTMTARDYAYSLNRLVFGDGTNESQVRGVFAPYITSVEATGDLELTIKTPATDPLIPLRMASANACVMPEAYVESAGFDAVQTAPVGVGPYKLVELIAGDRLVLTRHEDYWMGLPDATDVIVRLIPENATRIAALQSGEVDFITTISPDLVTQVDGADGLRVDDVLLYNFQLIYFNSLQGLTSNVNFRRALSLGIDREAIAADLWSGYVRPMNDYFLPGELAYDADRPVFAYDPEAAMRELEAAGYAGEALEFTPPSVYYNNGQLVTDVINELWKAIGVNVTYTPLETAQWADRSLAGQNLATLQSFGTQGDPATNSSVNTWNQWMGQYYQPNDEFKALVAEAGSSLDPELRRTNYRKIADMLDADVPFAPLYQTVEFYGVRENITWTPHQEFYIDLRPGAFTIG
jgi:peptide/nickel transport system substrate-binding protein